MYKSHSTYKFYKSCSLCEFFLRCWRYIIGKNKMPFASRDRNPDKFFRKIAERLNWLENKICSHVVRSYRAERTMRCQSASIRADMHYIRSAHHYHKLLTAKSNTKIIRCLATSLIRHGRWRGALRLLQEFKRRSRRI